MTHEIPVALDHRLTNLGIVLKDSQVQRHTAFDLIGVQHLSHAPEASAIAIITIAVLAHIRVRHAWPRIALAIVVRQILVVLDIGCDPKCEARIVGPGNFRTINNRAIGNAMRGQGHRKTSSPYGMLYAKGTIEDKNRSMIPPALFLYPKTALYTICVYILLHQATLEPHIAWMQQRLRHTPAVRST